MHYDSILFFEALSNIENASKSLSSLDAKFIDTEYSSILENVEKVNKGLNGEDGLINKMYDAARRLTELDSNFLYSYLEYLGKYNGDIIDLNISEFFDIEEINLEEYLIDYFLEHGNDGTYMNDFVKQIFPHISKCSLTGNFNDTTDFQNIFMTKFSNRYPTLKAHKKDIEGKSIREIAKYFKGKDNSLYKTLCQLSVYGFADCKIVEIVEGPDNADAFSAIVLSDKFNNYEILNNCTENQISDYSFDAAVCLEYLSNSSPGLNNVLSFITDNKDILNSIFKVDKKSLNKIQFSEETYKELAVNLAKSYALKANEQGTNISIHGYSLGGALAQYETNYLLENYPNLVGQVTVLNGLNPNLTKEEFDRMKSLGQDKFHVYINQGDIVSKIVNEDVYSDYAINIAYDWKKEIDNLKSVADINNGFINLDSYKQYISYLKFDKDFNTLYDNLKYVTIPFSGSHSESIALRYDCFNEDGSLDKNVPSVSFDEASKYIFGVNAREVLLKNVNTRKFTRYSKAVEPFSNIVNETKGKTFVEYFPNVVMEAGNEVLEDPELIVTGIEAGGIVAHEWTKGKRKDAYKLHESVVNKRNSLINNVSNSKNLGEKFVSSLGVVGYTVITPLTDLNRQSADVLNAGGIAVEHFTSGVADFYDDPVGTIYSIGDNFKTELNKNINTILSGGTFINGGIVNAASTIISNRLNK